MRRLARRRERRASSTAFLRADLRRHPAVAGQDIPENRILGIVGGIVNEEAGAVDLDDLRPLIGDAPGPRCRDGRMQEDPLRRPGDPRRRHLGAPLCELTACGAAVLARVTEVVSLRTEETRRF